MTSLKEPIHSMLENYFYKALKLFNSKLSVEEQSEIYIGRNTFNLLYDVQNASVINIYAVKTETQKEMEFKDYVYDTVTFNIDVIVSSSKEIKSFKSTYQNTKEGDIYQDELTHKTLMLYTNFVRGALTDISVQDYGAYTGLKKCLGDFSFISSAEFVPEYSESERITYASKLVFTISCPFTSSDSNIYNELKNIFLQLGSDLGLNFNYRSE